MRILDSMLNLPNNKKVKDYQKYFADNWAGLKTKYGESALTEAYISQEASEAYNTNPALKFAIPCNNLSGYTVCSAGATSLAMLAAGACTSLLIGAPFCYALVAIAQVAQINDCSMTYCGSSIFLNNHLL